MAGDPQNDQGLDLDLALASLRADRADAVAYFDALTVRMEQALPGQVFLEKPRRPPKSSPQLVVRFGDNELRAGLVGNEVRCSIRHVVRGIVLNTEEVGFDQWLRRFVELLGAEAQRSDAARQAFERLLS